MPVASPGVSSAMRCSGRMHLVLQNQLDTAQARAAREPKAGHCRGNAS